MELLLGKPASHKETAELLTKRLRGPHSWMYYNNYVWTPGVADVLVHALEQWYQKNHGDAWQQQQQGAAHRLAEAT